MGNGKEAGIGAKGEKGTSRRWYYIEMIIIAAYMAWSFIGVSTDSERWMLIFYMIFLYIPSIIFIIGDNATKGNRLEWLDSVTVEDTPVKYKFIVIGSLIFSVFVGWRIAASQIAFVDYPKFAIVSSPIFGALTSGVCGLIENMFFFSLAFPTLLATLNMKWENKIVSAIVSGIIVSLGFFVFHFFVYASIQTAFFSTLIFAVLNITMTYALKTITLSDGFHFSNNVVASLVSAGVSFLFF